EHLTSDAVVASLMSLPKYGEGIGVHRILYLLQEIASTEWYRALDAIRVTGSKGKGSVTTLTAAILRPFGRVGVFTSPHLVDFAERIRIDDAPIPAAALSQLVSWIMALRSR